MVDINILHFTERGCSNMSRWAKLKIIIGAIVSIFVILVIVLLINVSRFINSKYEQPSTNQLEIKKEQTINKKLNIDDNIAEIVRQTAMKNNKWDNLPLSKTFKKKYNSKDGILINDNYTKLSWSLSGTNTQQQIVTLIVFHNSKKEYYYIHYTINENNELDDVEVVDKKLLYDENGNEVIYKVSMDKDNYEFNISRLAYPFGADRDPRDYINMTNKYIDNYYNGFIQIPVADRITALPMTKISNYNNKIVYLEVEYCIYNGDEIGDWYGPIYYRVNYTTDVNMWLDDVEVEEVSKEEIDRLLSEKEKESNP